MPDPEEHDIRMWVSLLLPSDDDGRGGGGGIRNNARLPSCVPLTFCGLASGAVRIVRVRGTDVTY